MKKLETNWAANAFPKNNKTYFCHAIYNPDKPTITLEEALQTGKEPNPQSMFSEKEKLEQKDLPEGFKLCKKVATKMTKTLSNKNKSL